MSKVYESWSWNRLEGRSSSRSLLEHLLRRWKRHGSDLKKRITLNILTTIIDLT